MRGKHHKGKPSSHHAICETEKCKEYFNINYKNCNGKCNHCNKKEKNERNLSRSRCR